MMEAVGAVLLFAGTLGGLFYIVKFFFCKVTGVLI